MPARRPVALAIPCVCWPLPKSSDRAIREAYALGLREFGENYVQEFETQAARVKRSGRRAFPSDWSFAEQQERPRRAAVFRASIPWIRQTGARLDGRPKPWTSCWKSNFRRKGPKPARREAACPTSSPPCAPARICAPLGLMTMPPWSDDQELSRPYFRTAPELAARYSLAAAFDGHVARSGSCHRRRRHHRARGNGAVRKAQKAVKVAFSRALAAGRVRGWPITRRPLLAALRRHWRVESGARHADVALYHLGNNQLHRGIYRRALADAGSGGAARCGAAHFFLGHSFAPTTSANSSTTTACGIARWPASFGGTAPARVRSALFRLPHAGSASPSAPWP